ncbi:MAG TPA: hypothetical protein DD670_17435 [Planctomycetaceae bacterium]|nr:hypothetical protein [Planctomycetaceae bacterium]
MILNAWLPSARLMLCCFGFFGFSPALMAQGYVPEQVPASQVPQPGSRTPIEVAERTIPIPQITQISLERRPDEHELMPALRWANQGLQQMDQNLHDYSAIVVKRERIDGKLGEHQWMFVKIRHKPFSVYMHFLKPKSLKGREVIYVDGANEGKLLAHATGLQAALGTLQLHPTSPLAMKDQHYPITEMGVRNLIQRLLEVGTNDTRYGECQVTVRRDAKINDRTCTLIEVVHPQPRRNFLFHVAKIFVDNELNVPIRYELHDWPKEPGGTPELIEEYTYLNLKPNVGFSDIDFDVRNPDYNFKEGRR